MNINQLKGKINSWCKKNHIDLCLLFGSFASAKHHANSDIDIALYSSKIDLLPHKLHLIGELEPITGGFLDLVILYRDMDPLLRFEILTKGIPLFIAKKSIYIEQQIYAIKLNEDVSFLKRWQALSIDMKLERLKHGTANSKTKN
ncbi:nucleotidyltransferase domain-containing protein [candidate division KSB1 bacterium]|nr:nucleotidyltransferase domain-containing protein [candidate division KSB1 bacterium]